MYHRQHLSGLQKKEMNTGRIWPCCIVLRREGGKAGRRMEGEGEGERKRGKEGEGENREGTLSAQSRVAQR